MPRCCSVSGCKSNYKSSGGENVSTFSLPRNEELKKKWLRKIPTDFTNIKKPIVCSKHFTEDCIIRTEQFIVNNEIKVFQRTLPKLKPGAVPSLFPRLFSYSSSSDAEQENLDTAIASDWEEFEIEQEIRTTEDVIKCFLDIKHELKEDWVYVDVPVQKKVVLCMMNVVNIPSVISSLSVCENLCVSVTVNGVKMTVVPKQFQYINRESVLKDILIYIEKLNTIPAVNNAFV